MRTKERSRVRPKEVSGRRTRPAPLGAGRTQPRTHPAALAARAAAGALTPGEVLQLQRALGNRAVTSLLAGDARRGAARGESHAARLEAGREGSGAKALPEGLRAGAERLSGVPLADVRVRYDSPAPARFNALAYTRGDEIHLAPGQDRHLAHETWHVVQQRQGRVRPTRLTGGFAVNDERGLEREADLMGGRAAAAQPPQGLAARAESEPARPAGRGVVQLFSAAPANPPANGVRGRQLNAQNVPVESHVTTRHGQANELVGAAPGAIIHGWNYIQAVNATGAWVRFHLVNENIGGLGDQNNLVPASHATNHQSGWRNFERTCQHHEAQQTGLHVTVDVRYPAAAAHPTAGTLQANQHFYPDLIRGRCYLWNAVANAYQLPGNRAPASQNTYSVDVTPFPLQPPASAAVTNLTQQTAGWLRNTLMAGGITAGQADTMHDALHGNYMGESVQDYIALSLEPTPEMELLDALDSFIAAELQLNLRVPANAREQILNGSYRL